MRGISGLGEAIVWLALGAITAWLLYRPVTGLLVASGAIRRNYAGRDVPVAGGLVFVFAALAVGALQWARQVWSGVRPELAVLEVALLVTLVGFCLFGLVDDLLGSRETGGFKGHFRLLLTEGRLTSGVVKALGGLLLAVFPGAAALAVRPGAGRGWLGLAGEAGLNAVIIALSANAINLLDLRPGRAFKGFVLLGAGALALGAPGHPVWGWLSPLAGAAAVFAGHDLRAEVMMGDTGSNVLGAAVGVAAAWTGGFGVRLGWLLALVLFHLYTERTSLSVKIEQVPALRWLDRLGRRRELEAGRK
ncbi:MAG: hypothetical protein ACM3RP_10805 [Chitinophagales bacterium]